MPGQSDVLELRFHGRGGQGVVTAAQLLVDAALREGKWGQAIPLFGAERRGAPVVAYARISRRPLTLHSGIRRPDAVVILDPYVLKLVNVVEGLKEGGAVVINSPEPPTELLGRGYRVFYVNATRIALRLGLVVAGWPVVNTAMLGAVARALGVVGIESVISVVKEQWPGRLGELNAKAALQAFEEVVEARGQA